VCCTPRSEVAWRSVTKSPPQHQVELPMGRRLGGQEKGIKEGDRETPSDHVGFEPRPTRTQVNEFTD
jgi:hypothetical protein